MSEYERPEDELNDDESSDAAIIPADDDLPERAPLPDEAADADDSGEPSDDEMTAALAIPDDFALDASALDDLDIEGALASVASLSDVIAEQEAEEQAERERLESQRRIQEAESAKRASYYLPRPPLLRLQRGQLSSMIPAFLLMGLGAFLTLALATPEITLDTATVALISLGGLAALMIAQWASSGRWAGGALFGGLSILACIGVIAFLSGTESPGADGWPLFIVAIGAGALVSAVLSQPLSKHQPFVGLALIVAGAVAYALTVGLIDYDFTEIAPILGGVVGVVALLLLIVPVIARRQG